MGYGYIVTRPSMRTYLEMLFIFLESRPKLLPLISLMRCQGPLHLLSTIPSGQVNSEGPLGTQVNSVC
jgi:hypothetical protein